MVLMPLMGMGLELNPSFSPEAVAKYKEKADAGDAEAQYLYATALCKGEGTKKNASAAFEYAKKSADQGYGLSYYFVGLGHQLGWNGSKDNVESAKWYGKFVEWARSEVEKGNVWAQNYLGQGYMYGNGVERNAQEAARWFEKAAEQGNVSAQYFLGLLNVLGMMGDERNIEEAGKWFEKAAERGHMGAKRMLERISRIGSTEGGGLVLGAKDYRRGARKGDANSQFNLGVCYLEGRDVGKDEKEAVGWLRRAAGQGHYGAKEKLQEIATAKGVSVEELPWLFAEKAGLDDDKVMEIKKKSEVMKKDTLVFKGMHLGMSDADARCIIQSFGGSVTDGMLGSKSGKVDAFKFKRIVIDKMFKTEGVSGEAFCKSLLSAYPIIEKLETKYETVADVERQKKYKQDAENAAMRTLSNMASNGQDAYELGAAIGSKIRMNANQMTKEVPYYYFESPKGFVLEIHPDRPEMFFVLRSIAAIDTSNFD